ncbi:hypothetical protein EJB05_33294, partial [Eragrostis curvula]
MAGRRAFPDMEAVAVIVLAVAAAAVLSPAAAAAGNFTREVRVLRAVKAALRDPGHVLGDWDVAKSGHNPCNWSMVHCCHHGRLVKLNLEQKNLSGRLSPAIGRLTTLRFLSLSQNAISGPIPETIGGMDMLQRLDLSNNRFNGSIPSQNGPVGHLGHLKQYKLDEIQKATGNFCRENILGEGAFGIVYKGGLPDGSIVAVKRLKGRVSDVGDDQFHTEVEVISLIAHRNLLRLLGFCTTDDERILVYPYMLNGTVASKLQEQVDGEPALDWPRRKMIALGTAQGLLYLHEHCDPKIIHRDIKASNVLLDEYLEAVVADFGLAKLVDHGVSHIVTLVRGTIGRIPPEAVMVGHSSEKTDIFGFGLLLMEIVTGRKTLELHENEHEEGGILELAKELLEQNQLNSFVDRRLRDNYDSAELEKMVQIAMLCTMYNPDHRPRMSEVVRMLKGGDGVSEKWEALKNVEEPISPFPEFQLDAIDYDSDQRSSVELQACELSGPR